MQEAGKRRASVGSVERKADNLALVVKRLPNRSQHICPSLHKLVSRTVVTGGSRRDTASSNPSGHGGRHTRCSCDRYACNDEVCGEQSALFRETLGRHWDAPVPQCAAVAWHSLLMIFR